MIAPHTGPNGHYDPCDAPEQELPHSRAKMHTPAPGPHPLEPLLASLAQLQTHANHYVQATADGLRVTVQQLALKAVLGLLGLVVGVALLVTAAVLTLQGAAGGLAEALGGRLWAGQLLTGVSLLILVAVAAAWFVTSTTKTSRRKTIEKYERQHQQQRAEHAASQRETLGS